jgi:hypothetical protein
MINQRKINVIGSSASPTTLPSSFGATAQLTIACGGVNAIDFNLAFAASAANSTVEWKYEFSNDGTYFSGEDVASVSGNTYTHDAAAGLHQWTPGSVATHYKNVQLSSLNCLYVRVSARYINAGGTLWMEALLNEELT